MVFGEYVHLVGEDGERVRCRVTVPLGSGHPQLALGLTRLSDGARILIYRDGTYVELPA